MSNSYTKEQIARFKETKRLYAEVLPEWMEEFEKTGDMRNDPYIRDWPAEFTPIESNVWPDIRGYCLPFLPQFPACGYFLDFACPFKKIAIECDGAAYHDAERDAIRDKVLADDGWMVFRLKGRECNNLMDEPWDFDKFPEGAPPEYISKWIMQSASGVLFSIKYLLFETTDDCKLANENYGLLVDSLNDHCTTSKFVRVEFKKIEIRKR